MSLVAWETEKRKEVTMVSRCGCIGNNMYSNAFSSAKLSVAYPDAHSRFIWDNCYDGCIFNPSFEVNKLK